MSHSDILLVQSLWNSQGINLSLLFFSENSERGTRVWAHYSTICKCHRNGLLSAPVSREKNKKKQLWQRLIQPESQSPEIRCAVPTSSKADHQRLRQTFSVSADRLEEAPSKTNTGHWHGPLFCWPSSTFLQTPSGAPLRVRRTATAPPPGKGEPTAAHLPHDTSNRQRTPVHVRCLNATSESFKTRSLVGIY